MTSAMLSFFGEPSLQVAEQIKFTGKRPDYELAACMLQISLNTNLTNQKVFIPLLSMCLFESITIKNIP